ncbi:hypothetical protein VKT23_013455 [Stygiomarasmius scandens]|uniref:EthD domain-containing protein n=1 Tax=Marasmiellus scandens TaxID=2682957 RepID=A0ABR1J6T6_9AGAR
MSTPHLTDPAPTQEPRLRKDRVRLLYLLSKRDDVSFEDFQRYWLDHAPVFLSCSEVVKTNLLGYEQQHVNRESKEIFEKMGMKMAKYDGIAILEALRLHHSNQLFRF